MSMASKLSRHEEVQQFKCDRCHRLTDEIVCPSCGGQCRKRKAGVQLVHDLLRWPSTPKQGSLFVSGQPSTNNNNRVQIIIRPRLLFNRGRLHSCSVCRNQIEHGLHLNYSTSIAFVLGSSIESSSIAFVLGLWKSSTNFQIK